MFLNLARGEELSEAGEGASAQVEVHSGWGASYVARLSSAAATSTHDYERSFLRPSSRDVSRAGNGHLKYDDLTPGLYEGSSVYRSYTLHRTYFEVEEAAASITILSAEEVAAKLPRQTAPDAPSQAPLPALNGSEKQVAWATKIRAVLLAKLAEAAEQPGAERERIANTQAHLRAQTSCRWWIDNRDYGWQHWVGAYGSRARKVTPSPSPASAPAPAPEENIEWADSLVVSDEGTEAA